MSFGRLHRVQDAVHHQRRRLEALERPRLEHPLHLQVLDVGGRDLREQAVPLTGVGAGVGQPVLRLAIRLTQAVVRDLGAHRGGGGEQER